MKKLLCFVSLMTVFAVGAAGQVAPGQQAAKLSPEQLRAEAYFNFAMGHYYAEQYEATRRSVDAAQAIDFYKRAYQLDPNSPVIGEQLAEMYFRSQRIRDAVLEAQEIIRREPDNLAARRLLARIYVRTLGDMSPDAGQRETATRAIEQYREILRIAPTDAEAALWLARLYRLQNEHDKAEAVLRDYLKGEPEDENALEQLTQLLLDEGRTEEAISLLEGVVDRGPTAGLWSLLGGAYAQTQQYERAEAAYRHALEMEPGEANYVRGLAQALSAQMKDDEALEAYRQLAKLEPEDAENYLRMAQIYRRKKLYDRAEESTLQAKELAPGNVEVIYHEALLYEAQGRFDDAVRVLSSAIYALKMQGTRGMDTRRTRAILYEQLGRLYRETQNYVAAQRTFQELAQLGPEEEKRAAELTIDTYRASKELDKALAESEKARQLYKSDPAVEVTHAMLLGENGETDAAARILNGMLQGTPADRGLYLGLAQVYERGRRFAEAEKTARLAEGMGTSEAESEVAWYLLGAIFERQEKYDAAEEFFKKVLTVNPRNAPVLNYYGYMLAERGVRLDEAVSLVERALDEEPNNGAFLDSLGWAYFKQNRLDLAEKYLRRAVERTGGDPTIYDHLGELYLKMGRVDQAAAEWERSLTEWKRALPTEYEADKVAQVEQKLARLKHRVAQSAPPQSKPQ